MTQKALYESPQLATYGGVEELTKNKNEGWGDTLNDEVVEGNGCVGSCL